MSAILLEDAVERVLFLAREGAKMELGYMHPINRELISVVEDFFDKLDTPEGEEFCTQRSPVFRA